MQSYIDSMNATITMPAGRERNEIRDKIIQTMLAMLAKSSDKFSLFSTDKDNKDIGSVIANVCILYTTTSAIPVDLYPLIMSWCNNASKYTAHQAKVLLHLV